MKKDKKKHIGKSIFWSYILVAALIIGLNILFYSYTVRSVYGNMEQAFFNESGRLSEQVNRIITDGITQTTQVSRSSVISDVLNASLSESGDLYYGQNAMDLRDLLTAFRETLEYSTALESLIFYDLDQDALIRQDDAAKNIVYHGSEAVSYLKNSIGINYGLLDQQLGNNSSGLYVSPVNDGQAWKLYYIIYIYTYSYKHPNGFLAGEISVNEIQNVLDSYDYGNQKYYLYSTEYGVLDDNAETNNMLTYIYEKNDRSRNLHRFIYDRQAQMYAFVDLFTTDIYCCYVTSFADYYGALFSTLLFIVFNIVIIMLMTVFLGRRFMQRNIVPVRRILHAMAPDANEQEDLTYEYIEQRLHMVLEKTHKLEQFWKNDFVSMILNGQESEPDVIDEYVRYNVDTCAQGYRILCVCLNNVAEQTDKEILLFCIGNVLGELLDRINIVTPIKGWDRVYFILRNDVELEVCLEIIKKGMDFMNQHLTITTALGMSAPLTDFRMLPQGKSQADYGVEFCELSGRYNQISLYDYFSEKDNVNEQPYSVLFQKIIKKMSSKDYAGVKCMLPELFEKYIRVPYLRVDIQRERMLAVASVISSVYRAGGGVLDTDSIHQMNSQQLYDNVMKILEELDGQLKEPSDGRKVFDKIVAYIEENYGDAGINAGCVCEYFHVSYSYVANLFKKFSGESLLDCLHKTRIRNAKNLLRQGKSVGETALLVGYIDARSFIRAFKRYEGMTPGQYKSE